MSGQPDKVPKVALGGQGVKYQGRNRSFHYYQHRVKACVVTIAMHETPSSSLIVICLVDLYCSLVLYTGYSGAYVGVALAGLMVGVSQPTLFFTWEDSCTGRCCVPNDEYQMVEITEESCLL